jgi:hypothetical protein
VGGLHLRLQSFDREVGMKKKMLVIGLLLLFSAAVVVYAQYTGSELERKPAENLYPQAGPGDLLIVDHLRETNLQLQEQTRLLAEQNRILQDTLEEIRKLRPQTSEKQQQ